MTQADYQVLSHLHDVKQELRYMATELEPHHLPHYSQELANSFHLFYQNCRVISDDQDLTKARIKLAIATQIVLNRCLTIMGMDSPNTM